MRRRRQILDITMDKIILLLTFCTLPCFGWPGSQSDPSAENSQRQKRFNVTSAPRVGPGFTPAVNWSHVR